MEWKTEDERMQHAIQEDLKRMNSLGFKALLEPASGEVIDFSDETLDERQLRLRLEYADACDRVAAESVNV